VWIASKHQRPAAPLAVVWLCRRNPDGAHLGAEYGEGYPHTDGAVRGIIVEETET